MQAVTLSALNEAGLKGIVRMAHKLHLVMCDALGLGSQVREACVRATRETRALLEKCRQLVGHFSHSVKAARQLCKKQDEMGMAEHILVQDMPTHWNSTLNMIAHLVEQKDVLVAVMSTPPVLPGGRELNISSTNWLTLRQMVDILRPFEETTKVLCGLKASVGHVIPPIHALDRGLSAQMQEDSLLLPRIRAFFRRLQVYQLASLCDPCIKGTLALSLEDLEAYKTQLSLKVCKVVEAQGGHAQPEMQGCRLKAGEGSSQEPSVSGSATQRSIKPSYMTSVIAMAVFRSWVDRPAEEQDSAAAMVREYMAEPLYGPHGRPPALLGQ
ncbi:hypothetical protein JRQ81_006776 [Phrynocephalus forsythii]|uniref:Uncharacterized protein n=1 Tax=Phrynocephalus forsythii TaxID=171643 RepID=A0A9Q0Y3K4_9SAUR|nr:hypothetical protein JRQ81_006776 [Phrynocephalus forsythii]